MTGVEFADVLQEQEHSDLYSLVRRVHRIYRELKLSLSVAESVTGGMLASILTSVPGGAEFFCGGAVCYQPKAKFLLCGVNPKLITEQGAVCPDVTREMAIGIRKRLQSDVGMAITGIAGPEPGNYPNLGLPGTIFIALSREDESLVKDYVLQGTRDEIRETAVRAALRLLIVSTGRYTESDL